MIQSMSVIWKLWSAHTCHFLSCRSLSECHTHTTVRMEISDVYFGSLVCVQDSYRHVMKMRSKELRKRLMVKFHGEEGLDYGGVARLGRVTISSGLSANGSLMAVGGS